MQLRSYKFQVKGKNFVSGACGVQVSCETGQEKAETESNEKIVWLKEKQQQL